MKYDLEDYKKKFLELLYEHNKKEIKLGERYYTAECSRQPLSDGVRVYESIIRQKAEVNGIMTYFTMSNYRYYQAYQIHEAKEEAQKVADFMNAVSYDGDLVRTKALEEIGVTKDVSESERERIVEEGIKEKGYFVWY